MRAAGMVRRIDDLGRIIIPKEVRRTLRLREGDPMEIFVDREGEVILKKYSPIGELGEFAKEYADSLYEATNHICLITDKDNIVAVAGGSKREYLNKSIDDDSLEAMNERKLKLINNTCDAFTSKVVAPIIVEGECIGAVIIVSKELSARFTNLELKLAETAASFLAKQIEQ